MTGAEFDSMSRYPPPRCHPNTRRSLRNRITHWVQAPSRDQSMLWIMGSAGTGKSAIAQTIAEQLYASGHLGATLFFSRPNQRDDPSCIIPTLAHQLAENDPNYVRRTMLCLDNDFLTRTHWCALYEEFIAQPFSTRSLSVRDWPLLIILDGLDECKSEEDQCKLMGLIKSQLRDIYAHTLLWMICSRPEPHLERVLREAEAEGLCWIEELRVDDPEAQTDVECYLRDEFHRISKRYSAIIGREGIWPPKEVFDKIVSASSGLFVFATTVTRFINQPGSDPRSQLRAIVAAIDGSLIPGAVNPLTYIDNLYLDILGRLNPDTLSTTLEFLGICSISPPLPVLHFTQLLGLDLNAVRTTLRSLHSVIGVPYGHKLIEEPLHFYHASFTDFLANPDRSGQFALRDLNSYRYRIAEACLRVLAGMPVSYATGLTWDSSEFETVNPSNLSVSHQIFTFAVAHIWAICTMIRNPEMNFVKDIVAKIDYVFLRSVSDVVPVQSFVKFLRWLYSLTQQMTDLRDLANFIRTVVKYDMDAQFLDRCPDFLQPLELGSGGEDSQLEDAYYTLVGFEAKTVLVLVVPNSVMIYSMEDINDL
ncbi:hypothetical protein P691DRAFT_762987 [Macrolepiota fuliginosa MF-IS2]|uniref:Nephrocystin 3-like N-terminal domain-containing protein n=1 Tax=Macrolepiota fuliginosa MF-IS2 TaxID=1400762 RepID=A0A9P5X8U9_9AGAR|nr:hypothetical protein P691DRAFT_762987 [Macrolepiota fuliginosa MF-IS2]